MITTIQIGNFTDKQNNQFIFCVRQSISQEMLIIRKKIMY